MAYADLAALQLRLGFADNFDNTLLASALTAAEGTIDRWCRRHFTLPTATETRLYTPHWDEVLVDDIATTTSLVVLDNGATVAAADYVLDPANGVGVDGRAGWPYWRIRTTDGSHWYRDANKRTVSVTAKFGWLTVPTSIREATLILASDLFHAKDTRLGVAGWGDLGLLRIRENGMLQTLLQDYVKPTGTH
jgi:hypothetical protein